MSTVSPSLGSLAYSSDGCDSSAALSTVSLSLGSLAYSSDGCDSSTALSAISPSLGSLAYSSDGCDSSTALSNAPASLGSLASKEASSCYSSVEWFTLSSPPGAWISSPERSDPFSEFISEGWLSSLFTGYSSSPEISELYASEGSSDTGAEK